MAANEIKLTKEVLKMVKSLAAAKAYLLFWLTFLGMSACAVYAYTHNDKAALDGLPLLLGIYAAHSATKQVSAHVNARMDADANTAEVINNTKES